MRFWLAVNGVLAFVLVFVIVLFMRQGPVPASAAQGEGEPIGQGPDPYAGIGQPIDVMAEPDEPRSAWEIQEDPVVHAHRISGSMTLAAVKAHLRGFSEVEFRNLWAVNTHTGGGQATMVCGEVSSTQDGEPQHFIGFVAAGSSLSREGETSYPAMAERFCQPQLRVVSIRYGEFEDGGWKGFGPSPQAR